jgi:excinuclease ABC subunit A
MKLARELSKRQTGRTLYLLDEPTTGLHFDDVRKLLEVLHRLADLGNSVIIIEHNLDVIRNADWILDLGPEGGEDGGRIVGQGRPAKIAATAGSYTGQFLTRYYASTNGRLAAIEPGDESSNDPEADRAERAADSSAQSFIEDVLDIKAAPAKPKRARRNTPAEDDLAATRAKRSGSGKFEKAPATAGSRAKKTGVA